VIPRPWRPILNFLFFFCVHKPRCQNSKFMHFNCHPWGKEQRKITYLKFKKKTSLGMMLCLSYPHLCNAFLNFFLFLLSTFGQSDCEHAFVGCKGIIFFSFFCFQEENKKHPTFCGTLVENPKYSFPFTIANLNIKNGAKVSHHTLYVILYGGFFYLILSMHMYQYPWF